LSCHCMWQPFWTPISTISFGIVNNILNFTMYSRVLFFLRTCAIQIYICNLTISVIVTTESECAPIRVKIGCRLELSSKTEIQDSYFQEQITGISIISNKIETKKTVPQQKPNIKYWSKPLSRQKLETSHLFQPLDQWWIPRSSF
jgi:hypothetical protein